MDGSSNKVVTDLGINPATGERVTFELDRCRVAKAELKAAGIPLYEVKALRQGASDMRAQATDLREKASQLEQKAGEYDALVSICARRDMELASKGMKLEDGRVVMVNGHNI